MLLVVLGARSLVREVSEERSGFRVGSRIRGEVGAYYAADAGASLPLRFDDGSGVELLPGARARVTESQGKKQVLSSRPAAPASR